MDTHKITLLIVNIQSKTLKAIHHRGHGGHGEKLYIVNGAVGAANNLKPL